MRIKTTLSHFWKFFFLLSLILTGCKQKPAAPPPVLDPGFSQYISGFTAGVVSSSTSIRIRLTSQYTQQVEVGTKIEADIFSFDPGIKGTAFWSDNHTIEFKPEKRLESGQVYNATLALEKLIPNLPDKYKKFPFQFRIIQQSFMLTSTNLETSQESGAQQYKLSGTFLTADRLENGEMEKILKVAYKGDELPVEWSHDPVNKKHRFYIPNIQRQNDDEELTLIWDGSSLGLDIEGEKEIRIPGKGSFKILDIKVLQQPSQHLLIQFSEPLETNQNLKGLITIKDSRNARHDISGNQLKLYPANRLTGMHEVTINKGIKASTGQKLTSKEAYDLIFEALKPEVRLMGKGVIIPQNNGLHLPFMAVNLKAVDVRIVKIFQNNVAQFLQVNELNGNSQLKRVGRLIKKKRIDLVADHVLDYGNWNAFSIDLSELILADPGAIYKVELGFKKAYSLYPCQEDESEESKSLDDQENWDESEDQEFSYWDGTENYYYDEDYYYYSWKDRENPCKKAYYNSDRRQSRNVLASDLGLIVKKGEGKTLQVAVTSLTSTQPLKNVKLTALNYQQQPVGEAKTDKEGMAEIHISGTPFLLMAEKENQKGYLKLNDGNSLSLSKFDVAGEKIKKGLKGFIYGERGVWRPGDSIFVSFILEDKTKSLPSSHPVVFELVNPMGQITERQVKTFGQNGFFVFKTKTEDDAPTGNWTARIKVGGTLFTKSLRIETVKPNRLKIKIDFGKDRLSVTDTKLSGKLSAKWLHGAIAGGLKAKVNVSFRSTPTHFKRYSDFTFDDPARSFDPEEQTLLDKTLNEKGELTFSPSLSLSNNTPGMVRATFTTRVFEKGGDYSIDQFSIPYAPYHNFVGIRPPKGDKRRGMLLTDKDQQVEVVTVDPDGKPVSVKGLKAYVYKVSWRWWWDSSADNLGSYSGTRNHQPIMVKTFNTVNGEGAFSFRVNYPDWGRYLIRVVSPNGHATGKPVYVDWPGWAGRPSKDNLGGASMLIFSSDKEKYQVGEKATITFPSQKGGRALVSLESGSKVLNMHWVETQDEQTTFAFPVTSQMSPNIYVHVTLLQPHAQTKNDLPIRLYGVIPVMVEDPDTHIQPVISMKDVIRSEETFKITVSEAHKKSMTYTLAIVDEGLLDLTRFQTPNPWSSFYKREALGIKTWDLYDMVLGAYGGQLEALFAIGGDESLRGKDKQKANRFKPVVHFMGPFHLKGGKKQIHTITMPPYIGSVRTMVVAGFEGAYGAAQKAVPVKDPLMVLATLPRVVGPGETVKLPVSVFAMDDKIKNVKVSVTSNDLLSPTKGSSQKVTFAKQGEKEAYFELKVANKLGVGKITVIAQSGKEKAEHTIEIQVRNPNPPQVKAIAAIVQPGESWEQSIEAIGMEGTNNATLEVSNMPPVNFGKRLKYLLNYPHGCIEQTTSAAFPQLFLENVMEIEEAVKNKTAENIMAALNRLKSFQLPSGGLSYWPGQHEENEWGTNYAGHFMLEAQAKGYQLPIGLKDNWISFQKNRASNYQHDATHRYQDLTQAYRLYTLALAGQPQMGAMNRLREQTDLSRQARWRLAAAYALAGQAEMAEKLLNLLDIDIPNYTELSNTFGNPNRDYAMLLETLTLLKKYEAGIPILKRLSDALNSQRWMSTQTTAYCLLGVSKFAGDHKATSGDLSFTKAVNGKDERKIVSEKPLYREKVTLEPGKPASIKLTNPEESILFVNVAVEGTPLRGQEQAESRNLKMEVKYTLLNGKSIDPATIKQGTDFKAIVRVSNPGLRGTYKEMALNQIFPSGWEIRNTRLFESAADANSDKPKYQDIRDDRVYTYFDLREGKTKTFEILLNAAYEGTYYLPAVSCSAMYDQTIYSATTGKEVKVVKP